MKIKTKILFLLGMSVITTNSFAAGTCDPAKMKKYVEEYQGKQNALQRTDLDYFLTHKDSNSQKFRNDIHGGVMSYLNDFGDFPRVYDANGKLLQQRFIGVDKDGNWILQEPEASIGRDGKTTDIRLVPKDIAQQKFRLSNQDLPKKNVEVEDFMKPSRMDQRAAAIAKAENGQTVKIDGKDYKVTVRDDGSKKFSTDNGSTTFTTPAPKNYVKPKTLAKTNQPEDLADPNPGRYVQPGDNLKRFNDPFEGFIKVFGKDDTMAQTPEAVELAETRAWAKKILDGPDGERKRMLLEKLGNCK